MQNTSNVSLYLKKVYHSRLIHLEELIFTTLYVGPLVATPKLDRFFRKGVSWRTIQKQNEPLALLPQEGLDRGAEPPNLS